MKIKKKVEEIKEPIIEEAVIEEPVVEEPKKEEKNTEPVFYVVAANERVSDVAKKFGTTEEKIMELNHSSNIIGGNKIRVK